MLDRIRPLRTEQDYDNALTAVASLMDAAPGSEEEERLEVLSVLVADYERRRYPMPLPDPVAYIQHVMEARGLSQKDLVAYLGSPSRVSEVLNRRRALSKEMIRALSAGLGLSADVLVRDYALAAPSKTAA